MSEQRSIQDDNNVSCQILIFDDSRACVVSTIR
jgi:hypothetical protein